MNARESLAADRDAEAAFARAEDRLDESDTTDSECVVFYLRAIAAELRAARVYANYLEGREGVRTRAKGHLSSAEELLRGDN